MRRQSRLSRQLGSSKRPEFWAALCLLMLTVVPAEAHGLLLPTSSTTGSAHFAALLAHKAARFNPLNAPGLTGSISNRTFLLQAKNLIASSYGAGMNSVSVSALRSAIASGGQLQVDLYDQPAAFGGYQNLGEYNLTINNNTAFTGGVSFSSPGASITTPGFSNSLSFTNTIYGSKSVNGVVLGGLSGSGSERANQSIFNSLAQKAFQLGASHAYAGGTLQGGELSGTFFIGATPGPRMFQSLLGARSNVILAFGNSPANNPAGLGSYFSLTPSNYFLFANGVTRNLSALQIAGLLNPTSNPGNTFPLFLAGGSSPFNVGYNGFIVNNPASFLTFF